MITLKSISSAPDFFTKKQELKKTGIIEFELDAAKSRIELISRGSSAQNRVALNQIMRFIESNCLHSKKCSLYVDIMSPNKTIINQIGLLTQLLNRYQYFGVNSTMILKTNFDRDTHKALTRLKKESDFSFILIH